MRMSGMTGRIILTGILAASFAPSVSATGTHGCKIRVTNEYPHTIEVSTYNGDDKLCLIPHLHPRIAAGETKVVKAHSNGRHGCKILVENDITDEKLCKKQRNSCLDDSTIKVKKEGRVLVDFNGHCSGDGLR